MAHNDRKAFLVLGHGTEETVDFETRPELPQGCTLVTVAECGIITTKDEVCPMVEAFTVPSNRDVLMNPRMNKGVIEGYMGGKKIHIYRPGSKYPKLSLQMFLDWPASDKTEIFKSGVYQFPIQKSEFEIGTGATFCDRLFKTIGKYVDINEKLPADYDPQDQFGGSLIPTVDEVIEKIRASRSSSDKLKKSLRYSLAVIVKCGPGVYYYIVCRAPKGVKTPYELVEEEGLLNKARYEDFLGLNWASRVSNIIPLMEKNLANLDKKPKKPWYRNVIANTLNEYKKLRAVPRIRAMSIEQQEAGRRQRKTRRVLRSRRTKKNKRV